MTIDFLLERIQQTSAELAVAELAVAEPGRTSTYGLLLQRFEVWQQRLVQDDIPAGSVVSLEGDYGLDAVALLLALIERGCITVPLSQDSATHHEKFRQLAQVERRISLARTFTAVQATGVRAEHPLYGRLQGQQQPGLVLFTSGSTGNHKAVLQDLSLLLEKFRDVRQKLRTLVFLQLDHIGGINTLLYTLSNGGAVVVPVDRSPAAVCRAIAEQRVQLLPTSPTFLNLLLLSGEHQRHDLSSLQLVTYGTEPMPQSTLKRMAEVFPQVKLQQTYGMTELGILRSKSQDSQSLWMRIGGQEFQTKVKEGRLWVKAQSAMLGYLNAPSPFDEEGYFDTGDRVEVAGEWMRILGRESEIINVGGSKVYPAEVESVLLEVPNVSDVAVRGEPHPITGQIVTAVVRLQEVESPQEFKVRMRSFCKERLPTFAVPAKITFTDQPLHSERFKRMRNVVGREGEGA